MKQRSNYVRLEDVSRSMDRFYSRTLQKEGRICPSWVAQRTLSKSVIVGEPLEEGHEGHERSTHVSTPIMYFKSMSDLEGMARASGLGVVKVGEYDMDGVIQERHAFREINE